MQTQTSNKTTKTASEQMKECYKLEDTAKLKKSLEDAITATIDAHKKDLELKTDWEYGFNIVSSETIRFIKLVKSNDDNNFWILDHMYNKLNELRNDVGLTIQYLNGGC